MFSLEDKVIGLCYGKYTISLLYCAHFAWNVPLVSLIFLKRSLVIPILLFSSVSLHWSLRKAFLSLLAILWNSAFKWEYLSFSPLLFASLFFTAICKASSGSHFAFLHFFPPLGWSWSLSPVQCHEPPSIIHQALCLSDLSKVRSLKGDPIHVNLIL